MEYLIVILVCISILILLKIVMKIEMKELKQIAENKELDEKVSHYPTNIEVCKTILKKVNHETVKIEEDETAETTMYIAILDKIVIGNLKQSFTRIQTIAHECLHSIQDRGILLFNFIFSNIYIILWSGLAILGLFQWIPNKMLAITLLLIVGMVYFMVRAYLENDAMIKARFVAKDYMEDLAIQSKQEINEIVNEYDKLNNSGIKLVNFQLLMGVFVKVIILAIIFWIR